MTHNGWSNYETWYVVAEIDNDEGLNEEERRIVDRAVRHADGGLVTREEAIAELAVRLKGMYPTDGLPVHINWSDVSWLEIAESRLNDRQ